MVLFYFIFLSPRLNKDKLFISTSLNNFLEMFKGARSKLEAPETSEDVERRGQGTLCLSSEVTPC